MGRILWRESGVKGAINSIGFVIIYALVNRPYFKDKKNSRRINDNIHFSGYFSNIYRKIL